MTRRWSSRVALSIALFALVSCETEPREEVCLGLDEEQLLNCFFEIWRSNEKHGVFANRFLGISTIQNPLDVWITQEIMFEVKPDVVVETGTFVGGSAALWATLLEQIHPSARVITIDIKDHGTRQARELPIVQRHVDFLIGSSVDPAIVAEVERQVEGKRVLIILDSLHTKDHVLKELRAYSPMVSVGSYIIVQDTGIGRPAKPWFPWASHAVEEFMRNNDRFEIDRSRQRYIVTSNPDGFLKRVR
jgi:cephalosporin hydroxylase